MAEDLKIMAEMDLKRASLLSAERFPIGKDGDHNQKEENAPKDKFHLAHIVLFFFGFSGLLPMVFFFTSNDYWMYKFRDTSMSTYDSHNRTELQKNFFAIHSATGSIPGSITTLIAARYGHKINIRKRFLWSLSLIAVFFVVFTGFIEINTDTWQFGFFLTTIAVSVAIHVFSVMFGVSSTALISRFPPFYMKTHIYGTASASLFSCVLQVACLAIGGSSTGTALLYFLTGCVILFLTVCLAYFSKYSPVFNYYLGDAVADTARSAPTLAEMKVAVTIIWPFLLIMFFGMLLGGMGGGSITNLIVSEGYGHGNLWNDKYFVPVVTFLLPGILSLIPRIFAGPRMTVETAKWWVLASIIIDIFINPLTMFCNALPRKHLPIWFPHDWEYILLTAVKALLGGYIMTCTFLSIPILAKDKTELCYLTMQVLGSIIGCAASPLGALYVNLL